MKNVVTLVAITSIAIIEVCAITQGVYGYMLALSIAAISGLGGYAAAWKKLHH